MNEWLLGLVPCLIVAHIAPFSFDFITGIFYFKNIGTMEKAVMSQNPTCSTYAVSASTYTTGCDDTSYSPFYVNGAIIEVRGWGRSSYWESHHTVVYIALAE